MERKIGTIIQTPTSSMEKSLDFYSRLNFSILNQENPTLVSDGHVVIEINPDRYARPGIRLYHETWNSVIDQLKQITTVLDTNDGYLLNDPCGVWVYLMQGESTFDFDLSTIPSSTLGNSAGISLESIDMQKSISLWEILGFTLSSGSADQGWVTLTNDDQIGISIMKPNSCPHLFYNPSLTYFNGKENDRIIASIREADIPITEEITFFNKEGIVDNVILRDPGGLGYFIFND